MQRKEVAACLALVAVACSTSSPSVHPRSSVKVSRAASLAEFFRARDVVVEHSDDVLFQSVLALHRDEPKACNLKSVLNRPSEVRTDAVANVCSRSSFPARLDEFCATAPEREVCRGLRNNCLTIETSIFCDDGMIERRGRLARQTYFLMAMGTLATLESPSKPIFIPPLSREIARNLLEFDRQVAEGRTPLVEGQNPASPAEGEVIAASNFSVFYQTGTSLGMVIANVGLVASHELAHVEEFACPLAALPPEPEVRNVVEQYRALTCSPATHREVAADVRGIRRLVRLVDYFATRYSDVVSPDVMAKPPPKLFGELTFRMPWSIRPSRS